MSWTPERVEKLKSLWQEGHSASQVAALIGGVSRNAVIGKIHRLGLAERAKTKSVNVTRKSRSSVKSSVKKTARHSQTSSVGNAALKIQYGGGTEAGRLEVEQEVELVIPVHLRKNVLQLTEHTCKWPIGHPGDDDFYFCGRPKGNSGPYCNVHAARAYQQIERRK